MNTLDLKAIAAPLLLARSLGPMAAHAAAIGAADSDAGPMLDHLESMKVYHDVAGKDISSTALQLEVGPKYRLSRKLTLGGEWEPRQAAFVPARSGLEAYSFDLRISF